FVLDGIGDMVGNKNIGVGKPMLRVLTYPVESQVRNFYYRRSLKVAGEKLEKFEDSGDEEIERIKKKLEKYENDLDKLTEEEQRLLIGVPEKMPMRLPTAPLAKALGLPPEKITEQEVTLEAQVYPGDVS